MLIIKILKNYEIKFKFKSIMKLQKEEKNQTLNCSFKLTIKLKSGKKFKSVYFSKF